MRKKRNPWISLTKKRETRSRRRKVRGKLRILNSNKSRRKCKSEGKRMVGVKNDIL